MILCGTCVLVRLCLKFTVAATAGSEWMEEKKENGICSWDLWWMANACASKHNRTSCRRIVSRFPQEKRRSGKTRHSQSQSTQQHIQCEQTFYNDFNTIYFYWMMKSEEKTMHEQRNQSWKWCENNGSDDGGPWIKDTDCKRSILLLFERANGGWTNTPKWKRIANRMPYNLFALMFNCFHLDWWAGAART